MADDKTVQELTANDTISFAELSGGVVVIRIMGRGSYANSVELKNLTDHIMARNGSGNFHFILDLADSTTMDSTFMGVLASVGLRQKREGRDTMVIVNANDQSRRLLQTLGLSHFITVRGAGQTDVPKVCDSSFQPADKADVTRADRIVHMIEAHEKLCDINDSNAVQFESVLKYLHDSLNRETKS